MFSLSILQESISVLFLTFSHFFGSGESWGEMEVSQKFFNTPMRFFDEFSSKSSHFHFFKRSKNFFLFYFLKKQFLSLKFLLLKMRSKQLTIQYFLNLPSTMIFYLFPKKMRSRNLCHSGKIEISIF